MIDAALVRLRPVLVTVLATVGGLVPLAMKGARSGEPLCCVQIIGLLVATLVTKVVVPVLYVLFVEDFKLIKWSARPASTSSRDLRPSTSYRPIPTREGKVPKRIQTASGGRSSKLSSLVVLHSHPRDNSVNRYNQPKLLEKRPPAQTGGLSHSASCSNGTKHNEYAAS